MRICLQSLTSTPHDITFSLSSWRSWGPILGFRWISQTARVKGTRRERILAWEPEHGFQFLPRDKPCQKTDKLEMRSGQGPSFLILVPTGLLRRAKDTDLEIF